jgi:hypothetical protein
MIEIDRIAEAKERLAGFTTEMLMLAFPDYRSSGACITALANCIDRIGGAIYKRAPANDPLGDCCCRRPDATGFIPTPGGLRGKALGNLLILRWLQFSRGS